MTNRSDKICAETYREAISLYSESNLSIRVICESTGVGARAFSSYLSKNHRDLIIKRHNLSEYKSVKLRGQRGQTTASHYKYRDAIAACDSTEFIEYNISQIARIFDVDSLSLLGQLRRHYPEIVPRRERERERMGISANLQYGARKKTTETYNRAIEVLLSSEMTIEEVADECHVSHTGLREYILAYHPEVTLDREQKRSIAKGQQLRGQRNGSWTRHDPYQSSIEKYERAIDIYKTTTTEVKEIARLVGVSLGGLRYHVRTWHPELMVQRRGFEEGVPFEQTKRYKRATAEKYAEAIEQLKSSDDTTAKVATDFGLNAEVFRAYVKEHYPELAEARGMTRANDGRVVSCRSASKYAEALRVYETSTETLKSIAKQFGLTYNSLGGFIRRNHPEAIERHNSLCTTAVERFQDGIQRLQESDETINAVMQEFGYNDYFRMYVKANYPQLLNRKVARKRCSGTKVAAEKYAPAIELLQTTSLSMADIAKSLSINIGSLRKYVSKHRADLLSRRYINA